MKSIGTFFVSVLILGQVFANETELKCNFDQFWTQDYKLYGITEEWRTNKPFDQLIYVPRTVVESNGIEAIFVPRLFLVQTDAIRKRLGFDSTSDLYINRQLEVRELYIGRDQNRLLDFAQAQCEFDIETYDSQQWSLIPNVEDSFLTFGLAEKGLAGVTEDGWRWTVGNPVEYKLVKADNGELQDIRIRPNVHHQKREAQAVLNRDGKPYPPAMVVGRDFLFY